ncbi:hypothetical protein K450DRAFT_284651 [Umbelopsis ramanniana AG]|uniref:Uncharacterized protein n=1 Tax=Umbelopsis ramanniana AG TaxID=1314678 RepID=A0AAD5E3W1_UMBRA|nr:uncharacterized protein K450DRAFT_284651 [Umbelopsis ramanniana AG]KAI8575065.1 hypothetical protein K450DRAFT_284651 [Umbelopsis ramanniana AG]
MRVAQQLAANTVADNVPPNPEQQAMVDVMKIYSALCSTPDSFTLARELGITDCEEFMAMKNALHTWEYFFASEAGKSYAKLCEEYHSWRYRLATDFSLSLTQNAFALLVTIAATIISFTGIIQVVQCFAK